MRDRPPVVNAVKLHPSRGRRRASRGPNPPIIQRAFRREKGSSALELPRPTMHYNGQAYWAQDPAGVGHRHAGGERWIASGSYGTRMLEREAQLPSTKMKERSSSIWSMGCRRRPASATAPSRSSTAPVCAFTTAAPSPRAPSCRTCASSAGRTSPSSARRSTAARPTAPGTRFGPQAHARDLGAGQRLQLRDGRRSLGIARHGRCRRHLGHPGQHREDLRPDRQGGRLHPRAGRLPGRARRRPLHRLPRHPRHRPAYRRQRRHHPLRPPLRPVRVQLRRADARHAVLPRHQHPERAGHQSGADRHRRLDRQPGRSRQSPASGARPSSP